MKLSLINFNLSYGEVCLLKNINTDFVNGKINLIIGHSGCGKSSLLSSIAGFHKDFSGKILLNDDEFTANANFALAFQNPENLFFNSSVFDEISYALKKRDYSSQEIREKTFNWMKRWELDPEKYAYLSPLQLSGGEKRRVALAACTVFMPNLIMLDEPLAGLDIKRQVIISKLLNEIAKDRCVIVVTHEPETLLKPDSNILYINNDGIGENYIGKDFYYKSIKDEEFYPLPKWFQNNSRFED